MVLIFSIVGFLLGFIGGMRWQAFKIKDELNDHGSCIVKYGDFKRCKISGNIDEL